VSSHLRIGSQSQRRDNARASLARKIGRNIHWRMLMLSSAQLETLRQNLLALGGRRIIALALTSLGVIGAVLASAYYLSRPTTEVLYSGLERNDVAAIGDALRQANLPFDVSADGTTVYVPVGRTALARMTLAERGLPHSGGIGNELYDKLGSLGLTTFMQEVTRIRALEGELSRTIQMMQGVHAARVHVVMPEEGSFRKERKSPSASVLVRTSGGDDRQMSQAVRRLVASAVPGMKVDDVSVLNVDGRLLASGPETFDRSPDSSYSLERQVATDIRERITTTLAPYLSTRNFQVSVAAQVNTDQKKTSETVYDPESRVGKTVRVVKEHQTSQNAAGQQGVGVDTNIPRPKSTSGDSKQSSDEKTKREETTTYELSSKSTTITKAGYVIDGLSIAILVNRHALLASLGGKPSSDDVLKQVAEIEQVVSRAAGIRKDRGDAVKISVVDFADPGRELEPVPTPSILEIASRQIGSIVNGLIMLAIVGLLLVFAVRPTVNALQGGRPAQTETPALAGPDGLPELAIATASDREMGYLPASQSAQPSFEAALLDRRDKAIQRRLAHLIEQDEQHAAAILSQWIREGAAA
jgi:flagellar M-ring protein FliF